MTEEYVSAREFARRTSYNNVWISKLVKQGKIRTNSSGKIPYSLGLKDLENSRVVGYENNRHEHKAFDEELSKQANKNTEDEMHEVKAPANIEAQFNKARAAEKTFAAKLRELEYKKEKGELIEVSEVERQAAELASEIRERLFSLPSRLATTLEGKKSAVIQDILQHEINEAIKAMHNDYNL